MVVVGGLSDASACRDVGPFLFVEKTFDKDLALRLRQVVEMQLQDMTELVDVVLVAPRRGCGRVVLGMVIPREDRVELAIGDVMPTDDGLPDRAPMGMDRERGRLVSRTQSMA